MSWASMLNLTLRCALRRDESTRRRAFRQHHALPKRQEKMARLRGELRDARHPATIAVSEQRPMFSPVMLGTGRGHGRDIQAYAMLSTPVSAPPASVFSMA